MNSVVAFNTPKLMSKKTMVIIPVRINPIIDATKAKTAVFNLFSCIRPMPITNTAKGEQRKNADAKGICKGSGRWNILTPIRTNEDTTSRINPILVITCWLC